MKLVFNEWLKSELKRRNMSQAALALYAGVDKSSICSWCRGCSPNMNKAQILIEYLGYELKIVKKGESDQLDDDLK